MWKVKEASKLSPTASKTIEATNPDRRAGLGTVWKRIDERLQKPLQAQIDASSCVYDAILPSEGLDLEMRAFVGVEDC